MNENPGAAVPSGTEADPAVLSDAAARLNAEFGPAVNAATVDRILTGSLAHLTAIGLPADRLPALAERFARERLTAMARTAGRGALSGPTVLFVCTQNAGRSQMALGFFTSMAGHQAAAWSCGSAPSAAIHPLVIKAMAERGVDIADEFPKPWSDELMRAADVVIDMGCGDDNPIIGGHRFEQWPLPDPAGGGIEEIRAIRDDIEQRVRRLVANLGLAA
ncbi:arsenate reductase ArsC [Nocardia tengchongensis]|uniref:arsenate reductase ArsC n=1 Tax=Nocardia tengchongensis TaxID=2055889 RepID=UPI0036AF42BE